MIRNRVIPYALCIMQSSNCLRTHASVCDARFCDTAGMDHLLHQGRGAGGSTGAESDELQMACFMGLVSYLAGLPEVQRVSPFHESRLLNAVAGAIVQSGNIVDRPLTDAGLDGTGEVIQVTFFFFQIVSGDFVFSGCGFTSSYLLSCGFVFVLSEADVASDDSPDRSERRYPRTILYTSR